MTPLGLASPGFPAILWSVLPSVARALDAPRLGPAALRTTDGPVMTVQCVDTGARWIRSYPAGNTVRLTARFYDDAGAPFDPDAVGVRIRPPRGADIEHLFGVGTAIVRTAIGVYQVDVPPGVDGRWRYRWTGEGDDASVADEHEFVVQPSAFG
jgi:hypothetical protein